MSFYNFPLCFFISAEFFFVCFFKSHCCVVAGSVIPRSSFESSDPFPLRVSFQRKISGGLFLQNNLSFFSYPPTPSQQKIVYLDDWFSFHFVSISVFFSLQEIILDLIDNKNRGLFFFWTAVVLEKTPWPAAHRACGGFYGALSTNGRPRATAAAAADAATMAPAVARKLVSTLSKPQNDDSSPY